MTPHGMEERLGRVLSVGAMFSTALLAASLALWLLLGGRSSACSTPGSSC